MAFFQFEREQKINATKAEVWDFISSPKNLKEITPTYMGFDITSNNVNEKMYEGMLISYEVKPLLNIKTKWVTEITHIKEGHFFIDEQRMGPYNMWHHQHFIEEIPNGILMKDIVSYIPPFGFLGAIANQLIIKSKLEQIFAFRKVALEEKYGVYNQ
ncbi:MAG: SRPBCC family protein [Vicingaceae bacterium]|nr:SRPBCC family protein [Vicingaceae bacterium]